MKLDCLLCSVPVIDNTAPLLATHLLKAYLNSKNIKSTCIDLNLEMSSFIQHKTFEYGRCRGSKNRFLTKMTDFYNAPLGESYWWDHDEFEKVYNELFYSLINDWVGRLISHNARWIAISLFSNQSIVITEKICRLIKAQKSDQKIVLGGIGAVLNSGKLLDEGIIDAYVVGDGEEPLYQILQGNYDHTGINGNGIWINYDLDEIPDPDYLDIKSEHLSLYKSNGETLRFYIQGSKGCVRKCTFCVVPNMYPKYKIRPGDKTALEIINLYKTYGRAQYQVVDSLINGSLSMMRSFCQTLIDFYESEKISKLDFRGFAIIRPRNQMSIADFQLLSDAGCYTLKLGIESGSERVRKHMGKNFSNDDLYYFLDQISKTPLRIRVILMVGYPTETMDDFNETLDFVSYLVKHKDNVVEIAIGPTMAMIEGTPIFDRAKKMGIELGHLGGYQAREWVYNENNFLMRLENHKLLAEHCISNGFGNILNDPLLDIRDDLIEQYRKKYETI